MHRLISIHPFSYFFTDSRAVARRGMTLNQTQGRGKSPHQKPLLGHSCLGFIGGRALQIGQNAAPHDLTKVIDS